MPQGHRPPNRSVSEAELSGDFSFDLCAHVKHCFTLVKMMGKLVSEEPSSLRNDEATSSSLTSSTSASDEERDIAERAGGRLPRSLAGALFATSEAPSGNLNQGCSFSLSLSLSLARS